VQQALSAAAGGAPVWHTHTRALRGGGYGRSGRAYPRRPPPGECFACGGVEHAWNDCGSRNTRAGRDRLLSFGIRVEDERARAQARGRGGHGSLTSRGGRTGRTGPGRARFEGLKGA
jgi:hypothetical protein